MKLPFGLNYFVFHLPKELENEFKLSYDIKSKTHNRLALLAGIFFYGIFGILDKVLIPEQVEIFWTIRYIIIIPIVYLVLVSSYINSLTKYLQPFISLNLIAGGIGIVYMIVVSSPPVSYNYYAGLMLIFIFGYGFFRIRFLWASLAGWTIVIVYEISSVWLTDTPGYVLLNNNFFFISANVIGMFSNYFSQYYIKKEFYSSMELLKSSQEIEQANLLLEERVEDRTIALKELNSKLLLEIEERKNIQASLELAKESAERTERFKSEFLAQMSHEIRSPLNVVLNFAQILKSEFHGGYNSEIDDCFRAMTVAGNRIIRTIDLILNMSELHTGTYEPTYKNVDLYNQIASSVYQQYKINAASKNIQLIINTNTEDTFQVVDEYSIFQSLANLIDNAIKYTNEGEVEILIYRNFENKLCIDVADTGIGISEEYLPNLFVPFSQEEQGYTRSYEGNGLGLALVKKYCDINNADIMAKSKKNAGTVFTIIFNN